MSFIPPIGDRNGGRLLKAIIKLTAQIKAWRKR